MACPKYQFMDDIDCVPCTSLCGYKDDSARLLNCMSVCSEYYNDVVQNSKVQTSGTSFQSLVIPIAVVFTVIVVLAVSLSVVGYQKKWCKPVSRPVQVTGDPGNSEAEIPLRGPENV